MIEMKKWGFRRTLIISFNTFLTETNNNNFTNHNTTMREEYQFYEELN